MKRMFSEHQVKELINAEIAKLGIPTNPTVDGSYVLNATVSDGVTTLSWVLEEETTEPEE